MDAQVVATSTFDIMTKEEEEEAFARLRSFSKRLSSATIQSVGGRRRSSLADIVCDVNMVKDSFFQSFVKSTLNVVAIMRKEEKRSAKQLFCDVVGNLHIVCSNHSNGS
ncbi:unnamed protein product [Caenorhabditis nigoni]